jgi:hypothetical protein
MCRFTFPTIHNFKNECMFGYGLEFSLLNLEWKDSHMFVVLKMLQLFSAHVSGGNLDSLVNFGIFWFLAHLPRNNLSLPPVPVEEMTAGFQ